MVAICLAAQANAQAYLNLVSDDLLANSARSNRAPMETDALEYGWEPGTMGYRHHREPVDHAIDSEYHLSQFLPVQTHELEHLRRTANEYDNQLRGGQDEEEDDPAICFVKAYARKPLGKPSKSSRENGIPSNAIPSNAIDYWYDDYEYDNYGDYGYSDEDEYYSNDEDSSEMDDSEAEGSSEEESATSDEDDDEQNDFDYEDEYDNEPRNLWDQTLYGPDAHHFDFANLQGSKAAPQDANPIPNEDSEESSEASSEEDYDEDESSAEEENAYGRSAPHRRRRRGAGGRGRRQRRAPVEVDPPASHPSAHPTSQRRRRRRRGGHVKPPPEEDEYPQMPMMDPIIDHRAPAHDRHAPPPSVRRHKKAQRKRRRESHKPMPPQPMPEPEPEPQHQPSHSRRSRRRGQESRRKRGGRRHPRPQANEDIESDSLFERDEQESDPEDFTCPKFFEKTEKGCEKPLSLWRGNGQKKKCRNCQKCEDKWYPVCPPSFVVTECDVCAPVCPEGFVDHDGTCVKPGVTVIEECGHDE